LINNAGIGSTGDFAQSSLEDNCDIIDLNVNAAVRLTHSLLPYLKKKNEMSPDEKDLHRVRRQVGARVLFVGSIAGSAPGPRAAVYSASKAFLNSFALSLRREVINEGVLVSIAKPGPVRSKFSQRAGATDRLIFRLPFVSMSSYDAAKQIYLGMVQGRDVIVPGILNKFYSFLLVRYLPSPCTADLVKLAWSPMPRFTLRGTFSPFGDMLLGRKKRGNLSRNEKNMDVWPSYQEDSYDQAQEDRQELPDAPAPQDQQSQHPEQPHIDSDLDDVNVAAAENVDRRASYIGRDPVSLVNG
jgi:short-subunit dehydrogenase